MAIVATALQPAELASLRQLTHGPVKKRIPSQHTEKLVGCGFATVRSGVTVITTLGHAKLAYEVTRCSWFAAPV